MSHDDLCLLQRVWEQVEGEGCHVTIHVMSCDVIMSCFSHLDWNVRSNNSVELEKPRNPAFFYQTDFP